MDAVGPRTFHKKEQAMSTIGSRANAGLFLLCLAVVAFIPGPVGAQDPNPARKTKNTPDEKNIRALIAQLGDNAFEKREAAEKQLAAIGLPALELLRKTAADGTDLEARERAAKLVEQIRQLLFRSSVKDRDWGQSVDPDGDCRFLLDSGKVHIKIPGKPHRMGVELGAGATNAPRMLREIEGDFQAEVKVVGPVPILRPNLVGKYPWYGAGLLVWQDDNNYLRFERARIIFGDDGPAYANWELRQGGKFVRKGANEEGRLDEALDVHLKLMRKGDTFAAAYSPDGKEWKELPPITAELAKTLKVGVIATQNTPLGYEAVFEKLKIVGAK
jgi:regulation of enolase protein 1 (concanavalin A-like superfamily)